MTESLSKVSHLSFAWGDLQSRLHMNLHSLWIYMERGDFLYPIMFWNNFLKPSTLGEGGLLKEQQKYLPLERS